jgi:hypothetical protein
MRKRKRGNVLPKAAILPEHIKVQETIDRFDHDPRLLKPSSERMVVTDCEVCGIDREKKYRNALKQRRCISCSNRANSAGSVDQRSQSMMRFYADGGKHPLQGVGHSDETKEKLRILNTGRKFDLSDEQRAKLAQHCLRFLNNPETMERTRSLNKLRVGPLSPGYGKPPAHTKKVWHTKPDGSRVCFRSTWEAAFAGWLDGEGFDWNYETLAFPVTYEIDGVEKRGTYLPDFESGEMIFEVKGRWTKEGRAKFDAFVEQYPKKSIMLIEREWLKGKDLI